MTHLGANVSDDLARLSGKVEDAFAYADGAVSKNIGKHNARFYQSNGGNWDEVASGILGSSGAGRKAAAEFSDDASQALAKHGDEVSQALKETGEQAGKHASAEFGGEATGNIARENLVTPIDEEVPRLEKVEVKFNYKEKIDQIHDYIEKNDWPLNPRKCRILFNGQALYKHRCGNGRKVKKD